MKKQLVSITTAFFLGIMVMLIPILTYTQLYNGAEANTLETPLTEGRDNYEQSKLDTLKEATQTLGRIDFDPTPFSTNLIQAILLSTTSLVAALVVSLAIKRRNKLAVQDLITPNQTKKG